MPRKFSHSVFFVSPAGGVNSVRYHQEQRKGLPSGMSWLAKRFFRNNSSPEKTASLFHSLDPDKSCPSPVPRPPLLECLPCATPSRRSQLRRFVRLLP